jgi:glycosyltransferase involved in cell wall biosynthesis
MDAIIRVIIPAYNEENAITKVIEEIPELVREVIVVDNGSEDKTSEAAAKADATLLREPARGYGNACLKGIAYVNETADDATDIIVFLDGDYADYPEEMAFLVQPILDGKADLVIGSRVLGNREKGSMTSLQIFGNWLASRMMRWIYGAHFTDLGPFRAIRWQSLKHLAMNDRNYGWTVEMQIKAVKKGLKYTEVPVNYRKRIGFSKVSGTLMGSLLAGGKIIVTLLKYL